MIEVVPQGIECRQEDSLVPHRGIRRRDFAVFPVNGSARSPEAEEALRRQDVRGRADGRCAQRFVEHRGRRPRSYLRIPGLPGIPKSMFSIVLLLVILLRWEQQHSLTRWID